MPAAERAEVAGQLFGEEGSIAMARLDSATLRQATQDVRDFGVVVSEADADRIERAAVLTIHDMRSLLECVQVVRRTAVQTAVHVITTAVLIALLTGVAMKLLWFGPS